MTEPKRIGRPLKDHPPGTMVTIGLQVPAELKAALQARAIAANRSLSKEAELILQDAQQPAGRRWEREFGGIPGSYGIRVALALRLLQEAPDHEPFQQAARDAAAAVETAIDILTGKLKL